MRAIATFAAFTLLSACVPSEPRSTQYFEAHLDDAKQIVTDCRDGTVRGDECTNADIAIQTAEGREKFKRFLGKK
ncbi:EexN family lipoprotein [Sphingopyxis panaciterrae]